jgi:hypothetical protein
MTDYKKIQGFEVQTLSSDPTEPGWVGSIFYNSTSGTFKTVKPGGGHSCRNLGYAWFFLAIGGNLAITEAFISILEVSLVQLMLNWTGSSWTV